MVALLLEAAVEVTTEEELCGNELAAGSDATAELNTEELDCKADDDELLSATDALLAMLLIGVLLGPALDGIPAESLDEPSEVPAQPVITSAVKQTIGGRITLLSK